MQKPQTPPNPALLFFSRFTCVATLFLIFMGGLVKSHEAGLSVPDWPTTFQENMFLFAPSNWVGGIFYEHTHRLVASFIGLLTVILTIWVIWADRRRFVWGLVLAAFAAVFIQGILGGLTVIFYLPAAVSVSHAVLAQTFFLLLLALAFYLSPEGQSPVAPCRIPAMHVFWKASVCLTSLIFLQLFVGAVMRHTESGLAIPGFPLFAGQVLPLFDENFLSHINDWRFDAGLDPVSLTQVLYHFMHRILGFLVLGFVLWQIVRIRKLNPKGVLLTRTVYWLGAMTCLQVVLGGVSILTEKAPLITSLHVVLGAGVLGIAFLVNLRSYHSHFIPDAITHTSGEQRP